MRKIVQYGKVEMQEEIMSNYVGKYVVKAKQMTV